MERQTLDRLLRAHTDGMALVRAVDTASGEERIIDPRVDMSPLGRAAADAIASGNSAMATVENRDWFLNVYNPPQELVIVGAVHIAQVLAALATAAGYAVRVIDPRQAYTANGRFNGIAVTNAWPDDALMAAPLTARSALVTLSHDPKIDDLALVAALRSPACYIGALGSAKSHARRLERLAGRGFSDTDLARIHGPVGLAIGARTPVEIAIAILAQLVQEQRRPQIAGVILAAGLSRRMGFNKLIAPIAGKPMLRHVAEAALVAGLDPVIVVTGHDAGEACAALTGLRVRLAHNPDFAAGLSASLRAGIAAVPADCAGAMVLLGDMPQISADLIRRVRHAFDPGAARSICVATAGKVRGHPVLWGRQHFEELLQLTGDKGGRDLMARHPQSVADVPAGDNSPLIDIDTFADLTAGVAEA